jgi:hypothetical protein
MSEVHGIQLMLSGGANLRICGTPRAGRVALRVTKPNGRMLSVPLDLCECAALNRVLRNCARMLVEAPSPIEHCAHGTEAWT